MRFPNLKMAMSERRARQYDLAKLLRMSAFSISVRLSGQAEFAPHEKTRIAEFLGYRADWLFANVRPPADARIPHTVAGQAVETAALEPVGEVRG